MPSLCSLWKGGSDGVLVWPAMPTIGGVMTIGVKSPWIKSPLWKKCYLHFSGLKRQGNAIYCSWPLLECNKPTFKGHEYSQYQKPVSPIKYWVLLHQSIIWQQAAVPSVARRGTLVLRRVSCHACKVLQQYMSKESLGEAQTSMQATCHCATWWGAV